jgi:glutathione S-transferase
VPLAIRPIGKALSLGLQQKLINPNLKSQFHFINQHLVENMWLAGDEFSAADIQMSYPLLAAESRSNLEEYPHILDFLRRIKERAAYKKALEIGGPVQLDL